MKSANTWETSMREIAMFRINRYTLDEVLPFILVGSLQDVKKHPEARRMYGGFSVKLYSLRLQTFKVKGIKCVSCEIEGQYFILEEHHKQGTPHFGLYAVDQTGAEVLMTKDHIIPKSTGGKDFLENLQPMCARCNTQKGAK